MVSAEEYVVCGIKLYRWITSRRKCEDNNYMGHVHTRAYTLMAVYEDKVEVEHSQGWGCDVI